MLSFGTAGQFLPKTNLPQLLNAIWQNRVLLKFLRIALLRKKNGGLKQILQKKNSVNNNEPAKKQILKEGNELTDLRDKTE